MILLSLDFETTGLDTKTEHVIEVGSVLWTTGQKRALEASSFLVKTAKPITQEITGITGIHQAAVDKFGFPPDGALDNLIASIDLADAIIGQNIVRYDIPILNSWCEREKRTWKNKLLIDTRTDLPGVDSKHLGYMLADIGKINPFPHSALSDAMSVLILLDYYSDFNKLKLSSEEYLKLVVERASSPLVILQAHQDRADNALAKKRKFAWNPERKIWWKAIKQLDLDAEVKACSFNVSIAKDVTAEELWYS